MITEKQLAMLRHAVGIDVKADEKRVKRADWPVRNFYCTLPRADNWDDARYLEQAGLFRSSHQCETGMVYFHVTPEGLNVVRGSCTRRSVKETLMGILKGAS